MMKMVLLRFLLLPLPLLLLRIWVVIVAVVVAVVPTVTALATVGSPTTTPSDSSHSSLYDVVIVGGSSAGLSAALTLGRSQRRVLVIDDGNPCNRQQPLSYNLLTHDGRRSPSEILELARQDVERYDTVDFHADKVTNVNKMTTATTDNIIGDFCIHTLGEESFMTRKVVLATGVQDNLPTNVPGLRECWGTSVIHCPYCHGYEFRDRPTALWMNTKNLMKMAPIVRTLTSDLVCIVQATATAAAVEVERSDDNDNGATDQSSLLQQQQQQNDDDYLMERLKAHGIPIIERSIVEINHNGQGQVEGVLLGNGKILGLDAIYIRPPMEQQLPRMDEMDGVLEMDDNGYIRVDDNQKTSVDGIMACGDCTTPNRSLSIAIASGTRAAKMLNYELSMEEWQQKPADGSTRDT